eukprot:2567270-Ditylum_brightwellii.AAC.1
MHWTIGCKPAVTVFPSETPEQDWESTWAHHQGMEGMPYWASTENPPVMSNCNVCSGLRQPSKVSYLPVAKSPRSQRPTKQQLMPSSEGEVQVDKIGTTGNGQGRWIGQAIG